MSLTNGSRLGPYEIVTLVGEGGMGEVYRARDTRLDRVVAIKILPERLSSDPAARARFEREARAISHLNDPHICTLHDVGREGETDFLVMEYLEGQTLAARLDRGPLPMSDAVRYGRDIARALDRAHRAGIVHRDLKPANIMLVGGGTRQAPAQVKLMDFGLARGFDAEPGHAAVTGAATISRPVTAEGSIVGTLHYMAPEQLEGRETDARADVWALGCVLYEMATGKRAFEGASQASLIAAIIDREPEPMSSVQPLSPPALEHVVARCLAKDPGERWQSARDVAHELDWLGASSAASLTPAAPAASRRRLRERIGWGLAVVTLVAALVVAVLVGRPRDPGTAGPEVLRFGISAPEVGTVVADGSAGAISPDGTRFVLTVADTSGTMRLWIRRLDTLRIQPLAGTENAFLPFWSPDSRRVGFFAAGYLWQVAVDGGTAKQICPAPDGRGGSWNRDGTIIFAPGFSGSIYSVQWDGGEAAEVIAPDTSRGDVGLRFPSFLPDGRHFLYLAWGQRRVPGRPAGQLPGLQVYVGTLGSRKGKALTAKTQSLPVFAAPDLLVATVGDHLVAQRFDQSALELVGNEIRIGDAPMLSVFDGAPAVSVSTNGILAHVSPPPNTDLAWLDQKGGEVQRLNLPEPAVNWYPALSPDQKWVAVVRPASATHIDLWVINLERAVPKRLTEDGLVSTSPGSLAWSPDSTQLAYQYGPAGQADIYTVLINKTRAPRPFFNGGAHFRMPLFWSRQYLLFLQSDQPGTSTDLWLKPLNEAPRPFMVTPAVENSAALSPDDQWIAYDSDQYGTPQVYVRPFPGNGDETRVSWKGGTAPQWSSTGDRLLFVTSHAVLPVPGAAYIADVQSAPTFRVSEREPRLLFPARPDTMGLCANADLTRFLAAVPAKDAPPRGFTVVVNWQAALSR
jgi:Tol biopolymer transport system component